MTDEKIITDEIRQYNKKQELYLDETSLSEQWASYAQYIFHQSGERDIIYLETFTYLSTIVLGDVGVSAGAEEYFTENLEYALIEYLEGYDFSDKTIPEQKKICAQIKEWLLENGEKYEKVISQHTVRLDAEHFTKLKNIKGKSYHEKIQWLMIHRTPSEKKFNTKAGEHRFTWNFTYSEERFWQGLPGGSDREKLIGLLD